MRTLLKRFSDTSIKTKYVLAVLLLAVMLLLCGCYVCLRGYRISEADHLAEAKSSFTESYGVLERFERRMMHLVTLFQQNQQINRLLIERPLLGSGEHTRNQMLLRQFLYTMLDGSEDYACSLYIDPALGFADESSLIQPLTAVSDTDWARQAMSGWGWRRYVDAETLGTGEPALIAPIRDLENYTQLIAILRVDLRPEAFERMIALPAGYVSCYLEAADGALAYASRADIRRVPKDALDERTVTGFDALRLSRTEWEGAAYYYQTLPYSSWRLVLRVDYAQMRAALFPPFLTLSIIGGLMSLCGILFALPVIGATVARIQRFSAHVRGVERLGVGARLEPGGNDEVGQLISAHNALLDRIEALMRDREESEREMRRLEMCALQAQIKPHFLYNTLEAISWMARRDEADKVNRTVRSLTRFYRLCLSRGQDVLPVQKELEIVENYFDIQSLRYGEVFHLEIDVCAEVQPLLLPKITLQPLVENALTHGILESGRAEGTVRVFSRRKDGLWELCVADSGAHFTQEDWRNALRCSSSGDAVEGYGLMNVEKRLCLLMHADSVLYLDTDDPASTCIALRFWPERPAPCALPEKPL